MSSSKEDPPVPTNINNWKVGDQVWVKTGSSASDSNYEELATITKLPTVAIATTTKKTTMKKKRGGAKKKKLNDDDDDDEDKVRLKMLNGRAGATGSFCCCCKNQEMHQS